jgi:hypothetical protein
MDLCSDLCKGHHGRDTCLWQIGGWACSCELQRLGYVMQTGSAMLYFLDPVTDFVLHDI